MTANRPAEVFPPGDFIREEIEERGWTQEDLATILRRPVQTVNLIINGKKSITAETARQLAAAFGTSAELWLNLQSSYDLGCVSSPNTEIVEMAALFQLAPIKDMVRRNWIMATRTTAELRQELCRFYGVSSLDEVSGDAIAARRSCPTDILTPGQRAWYYRAKGIASKLRASTFNPNRLDEAQRRLRALAEYAPEARKVSRVLGEAGIRFLVVEPLPGTKMDGATFWLDNISPVIAISLRFERIDNFWFTIMHEFFHLKRHDAILDPSLFSSTGGGQMAAVDKTEQIVDEEAANALIPKETLDSFILRVSPFFSKTKIIQFALRNRIHPGIVVGQLHHRTKNYTANREMLVKVRSLVADESVTDGWDRSLNI